MPDTENSWCGHQQPFNVFPVYLSISAHFGASQEKIFSWIRSRKISCNRGKVFLLFSQEGEFLETIEKNPYFVVYKILIEKFYTSIIHL